MKTKIVILFAFSGLFFCNSLTAQKKYTTDTLPKTPIDTISTADPKVKIIIYTNNTWRYYFPEYSKLASAPVYRTNWSTTSVFAYTNVKLSDIPESMDMELIRTTDDFHMPVMGHIVSRYGPRGRRMHKGIDLQLRMADPVFAAFEGKVRYARYNGGGYGNLVILRHPNGLETYYGHLSQLNVQPDDYVVAGQVIGYGGSTGRSRGPHLHFEIRYADLTFDPERVIDFATGELKFQTFVLERGYFNVSSKMTEALEEDDDGSEIFATEDGKPVTSAEILENIEEAQNNPKPTVNDAVYYKVRRGDTLYSIARKHGTTVGAICKLNNIKSTAPLAIGKNLRVR